MTSSATQPSPRTQRSARTRDRVLEVATELMASRGYSGTTISAISKASGVMPASIYWHFESKEGLLGAVIERAAEAWFEGANQATESAANASDDRDENRAGLHYVFHERPDFYRVLLLIGLERRHAGGASLEAVQRVRERVRENLAERIEQRAEQDGVPSAREVAEQMSGYAMALLDGFFVAQQIEPAEGDALLARYDEFQNAMELIRNGFFNRGLP